MTNEIQTAKWHPKTDEILKFTYQAASRNCFLVPDAEEEAEEEHHRLESPLAPEASPQLEA